jgi:hypothetical protein
MRFALLVLLVGMAVSSAQGQAQAGAAGTGGCPAGTVKVGEREVEGPDAIDVYPLCRRVASGDEAVPARSYVHSGNGLVGGTGWQIGYYSPVGASPEMVARARRIVSENARRAGQRYDEQIDFDRYNFAIGIANETDIWRDLASRVLFDQLSSGRFTTRPGYQEAYNSLRGREFDQLGCHSNGAMVCLAALTTQDIKATHVTLYGPQVTAESLALWNRLIESGRIRSLSIAMNANDPVPPISLLSGPSAVGTALAAPVVSALAAPLLFNVDTMANAVRLLSPGASVRTFVCGSAPALECHDMRVYSSNR